MSNMEQMADNLSFMTDFKKLTDDEFKALDVVCRCIREQHLIACTACRYCEEGCPKQIAIPDLFSAVNAKKRGEEDAEKLYASYTENRGKASDCIRCAKCEKICPQKLPIRTLLVEVAKTFD